MQERLHNARMMFSEAERAASGAQAAFADDIGQVYWQRCMSGYDAVSPSAFETVEHAVEGAHVGHCPGVGVGEYAVARAQLGA